MANLRKNLALSKCVEGKFNDAVLRILLMRINLRVLSYNDAYYTDINDINNVIAPRREFENIPRMARLYDTTYIKFLRFIASAKGDL